MPDTTPTTTRTTWPAAAELQQAADIRRTAGDPLVADWLDATANALGWLAPYRDNEPGYGMWQAAATVARQVLGTTDQQPDTDGDEAAIQALSVAGAFCGECGFEPGDRGCPDCERSWGWYVKALRAAGWGPIRRMADEAQQPETENEDESCGRFVPDTPRAPGLCASCGDAQGWHSREAVEEQPAADQPDTETEAARLCGKTVGVSGIYYRPCARTAGHPEAYCRDATGEHLFLAVADPDTAP